MSITKTVLTTSLFALIPLFSTSYGQENQDPNRAGASQQSRSHRTGLSLSDIEPKLTAPTRPDDLKPLSARSVRQVESARKLAAEQRFTEASRELERALRYDPNHPEIHRELSRLHYQAGNLERARAHTARAIAGQPDDAFAHYVSGRILIQTGENVEAITALRTALLCSDLEAQPETAVLCHYHLAKLLAEEGYLEASLEQYASFGRSASSLTSQATDPELVGLVHNSEVLAARSRSELLEQLGRFESAAEALASVRSQTEDDASVAVRYPRLLLKAGRHEEALQAARQIVAGSPGLMELLAEIHEASGDGARIIEEVRQRLAADPGEAEVSDLIDLLAQRGQGSAARRELEQYLARHPEADAARERLVDLLISDATWPDALRQASRIIERGSLKEAKIEEWISKLAANEEAITASLEAGAGDRGFGSAFLAGSVALRANRPREAERLLRQSREQDPSFMPARVALAETYLRSYRYDDLIAVASRAVEGEPEDPRLEILMGTAYDRLSDPTKAVAHFRAAIQLDRKATDAMYALAKTYRSNGQTRSAQRELRSLIAVDPAHEKARVLLAKIYAAQRKSAEEIKQYEELKRATTSPLVVARCEAVLASPQPAEWKGIRETLTKGMEEHGEDVETWLLIAGSYTLFEQDQARQALLRALQMDPDNEEAMRKLIDADRYLLDFESATRRWEELLPRRPHHHLWQERLIEAYQVVQDFDKAITTARELAAQADLSDSIRRIYRLKMIDTLQTTGRVDQAVDALKGWAQAEPENQEWPLLLTSALMVDGRASEAAALLTPIFEKSPSNQIVLGTLIDALVSSGQGARAQQVALDRLILDPDSYVSLRLLVVALGQLDRVDDALELVQTRLGRTSNRLQYQDMMIGLLSSAGRHDEAIDVIETAIDEQVIAQPQRPGRFGRTSNVDALQRMLAGELIAQKKYDKAARLLQELVGQSRGAAKFNFLGLLASCQDLSGDGEAATETKLAALRLDENRSVTLNNDVAYGWIDTGTRLDEAEPMIRYAVASSPRVTAYLDTYGWLKYKQRDFAEAKKWLIRATRAEPRKDPVIFDHLGDTCWRQGEEDEAVSWWEKSVAALQEGGDAALTADEQRVRDTVKGKIQTAQSSGEPKIARIPGDKDEEPDKTPRTQNPIR